MPTRSLNSSVLIWPDKKTVDQALRAWAQQAHLLHPEVLCLGYFGSYARGDWGVGSDLDLIVLVTESSERFERRSISWDTTALPVPADILIYTKSEWESLGETRFKKTILTEAVWIFEGAL